MRILNSIAEVLMIIGAINWGLVGIFDFNLVAAIFGAGNWFTSLVYIVIGLAGLYGLYLLRPLIAGTRAPREAGATR